MGVIETPRLPRTSTRTMLMARQVGRGAVSSLELSGEADLTTLTILRLALARSLGMHGDHVVIDVTGLRFCDIHSAQLILSVSRTTPTTVIGAHGSVRRVMELLDSLQRVPRYDGVVGQRMLR